MTPHDSVHEAHEGPICSRCDHCENCCVCPDGWPLWLLLAIGYGMAVVYAVGVAVGWIDFSSGWGFLAGLALLGVVNALDDHHWAIGLAGVLGGSILWDAFTPDRLGPPFVAGFLTLPVTLGLGMALLLTYVRVQLWRDARTSKAETDYEAKHEAAHGIELIESYLDGHTVHGAEPRRIIGLSGYAGAGKDTVAAELMFNRDPEYTRVSFADPIRALALAINPDLQIKSNEFGYDWFAVLDGWHATVSLKEILAAFNGDWTEAKKVPAVRKFLQGVGAGVRDVIGEETWIDTAMRNLPDGPIVVTDCRFPNEAQAIKDAGGFVVRVTRPGVDAVNDHITEVGLDDWDFDAYVYNDSTPAEARKTMRHVEELLYDPDLAPGEHVSARP